MRETPSLETLLQSTYATPRAISIGAIPLDLKEAIVKGLGFQVEDLKVSGFDLRDTQMGHSVAYEFNVEVDNKVLHFKLLEDVDRWDYVDLPIFRVEDENGLVQKGKSSGGRVGTDEDLGKTKGIWFLLFLFLFFINTFL
ncbi:hypothetical protein C1H46_025592 [Malus baccata]|uniref:Uncharacterized protein n=1 Tax=Malus baccata TaxID=106549 RepID=A0A540LR09_MALBA|nr:hypothetical protein C1H46_025592 [Malus baccata]